MWIVDSSVWIDYFNGVSTPQSDLLDAVLGVEELGIGDLILCEVLQGFHRQRDFELAKTAMLTLPVFAMGGSMLALRSAEHYRFLRQRGVTVRKTMDCLIATFVMSKGFQLLHSDHDFDPFVRHLGLAVVE